MTKYHPYHQNLVYFVGRQPWTRCTNWEFISEWWSLPSMNAYCPSLPRCFLKGTCLLQISCRDGKQFATTWVSGSLSIKCLTIAEKSESTRVEADMWYNFRTPLAPPSLHNYHYLSALIPRDPPFKVPFKKKA